MDILSKAIINNAHWCDAVCKSHNMNGDFSKDMWINLGAVPKYYPNIITLTPTVNEQDIVDITNGHSHISVKDSFAKLDLNPYGFKELFEAQWMVKEPTNEISSESFLTWKKMQTPKELEKWELSWGGNIDDRIFLPPLLENPSIIFLSGMKDNEIRSGAVVYLDSDVVGISNVFTKEDPLQAWKELTHHIFQKTSLPIVGYEHGNALEYALQAGFTIIGPLKIWVKD